MFPVFGFTGLKTTLNHKSLVSLRRNMAFYDEKNIEKTFMMLEARNRSINQETLRASESTDANVCYVYVHYFTLMLPGLFIFVPFFLYPVYITE